MTNTIFAPGCALMIYKPDLARKIHLLLKDKLGVADILSTCCHHDPQFSEKTRIINVCPGCDKRFGNDYESSSTISLWEILAENNYLDLPDYKGQSMSIMDACPTRDKEKVHRAVRKLIAKMNITLTEPEKTGIKSTCCGDSFYGTIPVLKVKEQMKKRATEMPSENVIVYCVSCIKSVFIGEKKPRYLTDLIFAEDTFPGTFEPDQWHKELETYIVSH